MANKNTLNIIYADIGRGHPFYLDGICKAIKSTYRDSIELNCVSVFDLSKGLPLLLWKTIRLIYVRGSQGGVWGMIYKYIRARYRPDKTSLVERILARHIRKYLISKPFPTLVAHPILIPMISDLVPVFYQHGEVCVPQIAAVENAEMIIAPTEHTRDDFIRYNIPGENIFVSGLCVEEKLADDIETDFRDRLARLDGEKGLTGGLFSSGAEPSEHIDKIVRILKSLRNSGHKAILLCRAGGRFEKAATRNFNPVYLTSEFTESNIKRHFESNDILLVPFSGREQEEEYTAALFKYLDYFVAPSHERTNWALGLGIPMFILHPLIGPFSPLNRDILMENGVAAEIKSADEADNFSDLLRAVIRDGALIRMAMNGYGKYKIGGFSSIAKYLSDLNYDSRTIDNIS